MDRVLIDLGFIKIYWYSILILISAIIGITLIIKEARRVGLSTVLVSDLCFFVIPVSIIGARLYYVIFNFETYKDNLIGILKIWEGGIAIYGAIIVGIIFIISYCRKKQMSILKTLDLFAPSLILAQAIGRWGNFLNQEAFGPVTTRLFLEKLHLPNFIIDNMFIKTLENPMGAYHQPTFLYESVWCLIGFIGLLLIRYLYKKNKNGNITFIYFIWYGIGRFLIESLRTDSLYIGTYKISQIVSIILILIGVIGLITSKKRNLYKENKENNETKQEKEVLVLG